MPTRQSKTPPLSKNTKLLCFDLESNGLHGEVFAVGAIVMDTKGVVIDEFVGRCTIGEPLDTWVKQNVISAITDMPIQFTTYRELREAFWKWYLQAEAASDYVLVSNGYPVEYRFLLKCQEDNLEERYLQHPFPLLELTSLLLLTGISTMKTKIKTEIIRTHNFKRHHPLDDAKVTALLAVEAMKSTNKIVVL